MNFLINGWYYLGLNDRAPAWTGVDEFANFGLNNKSIGFKLFECDKKEIEVADVIQLGNERRFYHTVLVNRVVKVNGETKIYVTAHDNAVFDFPIENYGAKIIKYYKVSE